MTISAEIQIKVCGIKYPDNREQIEKLQVDLLGFIFYPLSKRYVGESPGEQLFHLKKPGVAVFVDSQPSMMIDLAGKFGIKWIQLHGAETPDVCARIKSQGLGVIKAFAINESFNFPETGIYTGAVDYFLFDTKSSVPGGSGEKFNWKILERYTGETPFFLSGGIQPGDSGRIRQINHKKLAGIDLNSGFEDIPGFKNIDRLKIFIGEIRKP